MTTQNIIFNKCPVCNKGKVKVIKSTGFLKFAKSDKLLCDKCNARFFETGEIDDEETYRLDLSNSNKQNKYEGDILKISEWKRGKSDLDYFVEKQILPSLNITDLKIIMESGEKLHLHSYSTLMEERAIRQSTGGRVRVMKGVYIGGSQSESHGQLREIDKGDLLLTSKRLIFNGDLRHSEYKLNKIVSVEEHKDSIEIGASNRKKVQIFIVDEPGKWTAFIKIAIDKFHNKKK